MRGKGLVLVWNPVLPREDEVCEEPAERTQDIARVRVGNILHWVDEETEPQAYPETRTLVAEKHFVKIGNPCDHVPKRDAGLGVAPSVADPKACNEIQN